ncbi:cytochrome c3 family protein [Desulfolithobacter sp.]
MDRECTSCHAIHASDAELLLKKEPEKICLSCHQVEETPVADSMETDNTGARKVQIIKSVHQPVASGNCMACHSGHAAAEKNLLKVEPEKLCLSCHESRLYEESPASHQPANGKACDTCHQPHRSYNPSLLVQKQKQLCLSCHKKESDEQGRFSLHRPFATGNCVGCHSLHGSTEEKYLKASRTNGALCLSCHENIQQSGEAIRPHEPVATGRCDACHAPHAADYANVIRQKPGKICLSCHEDVQTTIKNTAVVHKPAVDENCISCHAAHGSPHEHILKKGQPMLCLTCHTEVARDWRKGVIHEPAVKNCMECHRAHGSDEPAMINSRPEELCVRCHEGETPDFLAAHSGIKPGAGSCVSCHDAHGSPEKGLLYPVGHTPFVEGTCKPCHKGRGK